MARRLSQISRKGSIRLLQSLKLREVPEEDIINMVKVAAFDIEFNNPEHVYFAGQEISGKIILELKEEKKINEILLELRGRARTNWTKHSGKSRKHYTDTEPYFCEQITTDYTHNYADEDDPQVRTLPEGRHEVPFSYTLPKNIPSSFEGDYGFIRYTCKAICERPWDFDIISRKAFTVVGIVDINEIPDALKPEHVTESNANIRFCCQKQGSLTVDLSVDRCGCTVGEAVEVKASVRNDSRKTVRDSVLRLKQHVVYKAKTFSGHEHTKTTHKAIFKKDLGAVCAGQTSNFNVEKIIVPAVPPRLNKCRIIDIAYTLELETDSSSLVASVPIIIGSIPLLGEGSARNQLRDQQHRQSNDLASHLHTTTTTGDADADADSIVKVTVTDESGNTQKPEVSDDSANKSDDPSKTTEDIGSLDEVSDAADDAVALAAARKRVRMPSSILSELYPTMPTPFFKDSYFGPVELGDDKEQAQFGVCKFTPKYPVYI